METPMITRSALLVCAMTMFVAPVSAQEFELTPSPEGASVRFISPADGATVTSPVLVVFGLSGMGVAPAGFDITGTGHHHLILNRELPPMTDVIPASQQSLHFGGGQTETTLELEPGTHTLQLLFGDYRHIPHDPPLVSEQITITVE
ncbi:MAG: DUF4399 domain-containing protein [Pseudomonadota bacterium]